MTEQALRQAVELLQELLSEAEPILDSGGIQWEGEAAYEWIQRVRLFLEAVELVSA